MSGEKMMETRKLSTGKTLKKKLETYGNISDQGVAFINQDRKIIGWGEIEYLKLYNNAEEFYSDVDLHKIDKSDTMFGWTDAGKSGIKFKEGGIHKLKSPIDVDPTNSGRITGYIPNEGFEEDTIYNLIFDD